jgi:membrane protein
MAILEVLYEGRIQGNTIDMWTIRAKTRLGFEEIKELLEPMYKVNWVGRMDPGQIKRHKWKSGKIKGRDYWILLANPEKILLVDVYRMFVFDTRFGALAKRVELVMEEGLSENLTAYFSKQHI